MSAREPDKADSVQTVFEDLFDIAKRPGAGAALWTKTVEMQLERVRDINYRHRLHHSEIEAEQRDDPDAVWQLHADVYFLALAIRRVLLFHDLVGKQIKDPRLDAAKSAFLGEAPDAKVLRDFYEHLDDYLLDSPKKHRPIAGRAAPVLLSRWDRDNVVVAFGPLRIDVTLAAVAAIKLGKVTEAVYDEHSVRAKEEHLAARPHAEEGDRMVELRFGVSAIIGGDDEGRPVIHTGTLLDFHIREATPDEIAESDTDGFPAGTDTSTGSPT